MSEASIFMTPAPYHILTLVYFPVKSRKAMRELLIIIPLDLTLTLSDMALFSALRSFRYALLFPFENNAS